jgi:sulfopyruvate decarboxylase subunit beta
VARASGISRTKTVHTIEEFKDVFGDALKANDLTSIVAKVEAVGPKGYVTELALLENRFQFKRYIEKLNAK